MNHKCDIDVTMKLEPHSQRALSGHGGKKGRCLLHAADEPEINEEQIRLRAGQLSGVLKKILKQRGFPEHFDYKK